MIDIITVVFSEEMPVLRCQAQGIDLYCQNLGVRSIYVMVNDVGISHQIDPAWWGTMANRVRIIPRETFSCDWKNNGWLTQHVLKLQAAQ